MVGHPEYDQDALFRCDECRETFRRDRCRTRKGSLECPTCLPKTICGTLRFTGRRERDPYPELLTDEESKAILKDAENLWSDLQGNELGGFSGINRPFYILHFFKGAIEKYGHRDVGLNWSKNDLEAKAREISK
jgi:hypothetical protein